jgi:signal transduction histidine kinase
MRRPRLTIRTRLTLVYGGLFLLAGMLLLSLTYALVRQQVPGNHAVSISGQPPGAASPVGPGPVSPSGAPAQEQLFQTAVYTWQDALHALLTQGGIALALVGVTAVTVGWLIAGRVLHPLHQMTETARRIADAPGDRGLHQRIALSGPPDEVKDLADTFDVMLERLDQSFDGQRRFIANASHELRTPLAVNRALIEVALARPDASADVRQLGQTLIEVNARHERLIDGLLLLTRSERDLDERSFVDLADVVDHVATRTSAGTVQVETELGSAPTAGHPVLLERLVQNLVDNALRYNLPEGGWVQVTSITRPDGSAGLEVTNSGPIVPRYEVPGLFEPFRRLGGERGASTSPGAGLGLSIVAAIARAHGGEVAARARTDGGLVVSVTLPGSPPIEDGAAEEVE